MSNREKKENIVDDTIIKFKEASGIIITNYQGLNVIQINELRRELEKVDARYKVIKNTLSKRVLEKLKLNDGLTSLFTGVTGMVFAQDYVSAVKVLSKFVKDNENLQIKGGYIEEKVCSIEEINEISKISSKEELIGKLVMLLNQPLQRLANVLSGPKKNIIYALKAVADNKK